MSTLLFLLGWTALMFSVWGVLMWVTSRRFLEIVLGTDTLRSAVVTSIAITAVVGLTASAAMFI